ncbi:LysM domain protein [Aspergillus californicus]
MWPSAIILAGLLSSEASSRLLQKRWLNGNSASGTTDPDVTSDCQYWANEISSDDTCAELESYFDITITDLKAWNPSLLRDYCILIEDWSYCVEGPDVTSTPSATSGASTTGKVTFTEVSDFVGSTTPISTAKIEPSTTTTVTTTATYSGGIPSPTQSGLISTCSAYYYVRSEDTCYDIQDVYRDFTLSEFYIWNPSIMSGCSGLEPDYYVCVGVASSSSASSTATSSSPYSPQRTGTAANCNNYYFVENGDSCSAILSEYEISIAELYSWNPSIGADCSTMEYGYYVCVGVSASGSTGSTGSTPAKTTTALATTTSIVTSTTTTSTSSGPSPTQSGITTSCVSYYEAEKDDSCWSITTEKYAYLNQTEFIEWNPALGPDCVDLWVGYYYCVATTSVQPMPDIVSTCTQYYLVQSGDSCYSIEQENSITSADFYAWNPDVGTDCGALWSGYFVCIGA